MNPGLLDQMKDKLKTISKKKETETSPVPGDSPRLAVRPGVIDHYLIVERIPVRTCDSLNGMKLLGMHVSTVIEPGLLVVANGIDDQRVAFPVADRMTKIGWIQIIALRMRPSSMWISRHTCPPPSNMTMMRSRC